MNDKYYTQTAERPDLAALEVNAPQGYIGSQILPIAPVSEKSGTVYYATVTADAAAQKGRNAGVAPSGTQISDSSTTFTAAEAIKRGSVTPDEAKTMGGIEKADVVGAKWAKRQVMADLEGSIRTLVLGKDKSASFDPAKVQTQVQDALESVKRYDGVTALIGSTKTVKTMVQQILGDASYGPMFSRLVSGSTSTAAAAGLSFAAWLQGLQIFFGVDKILAGDDGIWNAAAVSGKFGIAKLDDGTDPLSHKWKPVLGKTFQFAPDGTTPWLIESVADRVAKNNHYDATLWYEAKLLNTGALYVFDGVQV